MTLNYTPHREPGNFRSDDKNIYFGVTNGRVAGRIAKGKFSLPDGSKYQIPTNLGQNTVHGGIKNYSKSMWDEAEIVTDVDLSITVEGNGLIKKGSGVKFSRISDHMDEGFPGKLKIET